MEVREQITITDLQDGKDGADGQKGDKGDKGNTGATGGKGDKGDKGDKGNTGATGGKGDKGDTGESVTGKMLHRDPEFALGYNGCVTYAHRGNVAVSRISKPSDCPTKSTHYLRITTSVATSPGHGGYYQTALSRANGVFISRIIAKIPTGYTMQNAHNSHDSGGRTYALTSMAGTGKYETYIWKVVCGNTGTFSTINHYYLSGGSAPVTWYVGSSTTYDMTDSEKYDAAISDAKKTLTYRGVFSSSKRYYNSTHQRNVVKYGSSYYIYKGANGASGGWSSANWESFGGEFESIATGILLAELAYIENLVVKNLRTATSGQRVEITQHNNSLAFYDGKQSTPTVEIKTTSDAMYMGQGSGILVKHPQSNISINNGILQNGSEGAGISVPRIPWGQPETIAQNCILQNYTNSYTQKYKTGLYIDVSGVASTSVSSDRYTALFATGGIFIAGGAADNKSNNVFSGLTCAGRVNSSGSLYKSWVISFMGGYMTSRRIGVGRYRISFSNTSYLGSSYFDIMIGDNHTPNDCAFTFIVFLISKFF